MVPFKDYLIFNINDDQAIEKALLAISKKIEHYHQNNCYIGEYDVRNINIGYDGGNVVFSNPKNIINDGEKNFYIKKDIFNYALFQISIFCALTLSEQGNFHYTRQDPTMVVNNFDAFISLLPNDCKDYCKMVLLDENSIYFHNYSQNQKESLGNNPTKQGHAMVKATPTGTALTPSENSQGLINISTISLMVILTFLTCLVTWYILNFI